MMFEGIYENVSAVVQPECRCSRSEMHSAAGAAHVEAGDI
jgi:hypothetical protein